MRVLLLTALLSSLACARNARPTTPTTVEVHELETMRVTARRDADGELVTDAYDAEMLFQAGLRAMRANQPAEAIARFDRVADEFRGSRYVSPSLYNAGLILKATGDAAGAAARFERLLREIPESSDRQHASFQLLGLYVTLERFPDGLALTDSLLRQELEPDGRVEAMARRAELLLGAGQRDEAASQARTTVSWARTRGPAEEVRDTYFLAVADFVYAETLRMRSEEIRLPEGGVAVQRPVLERRAQLLLDAQRSYFDAIRRQQPEIAAAAGYRIGAMYDTFWTTIMSAPVPPPESPLTEELMAVFEEEYRLSLARLVKPLIRHAIRYWELTLLMTERAGIESEWTERIRAELETARDRLLAQPEGPEGLPSTGSTP
ncbi:MAG: tetratricopeptide repeat protein [Myxococcales bacterium]|nr:tetratricopeptide repeat protein [Myxococcales bacterium]